MWKNGGPLGDIHGGRVVGMLGDSITKDDISPAGAVGADAPAGKYLIANGGKAHEFNSYGARRGNHEVMARGTFANIRLKNQLAPGTEGGWTTCQPGGERMSIYDASVKYREAGVPLIILAGKEYGSGSSRDWAAKGPKLFGVRAVIAESYERIHRSNLVGMGILPLQFASGENASSLGLTGEEVYEITSLETAIKGNRQVTVKARAVDGKERAFKTIVRIDTPQEVHYYKNGGILPYLLPQLLG